MEDRQNTIVNPLARRRSVIGVGWAADFNSRGEEIDMRKDGNCVASRLGMTQSEARGHTARHRWALSCGPKQAQVLRDSIRQTLWSVIWSQEVCSRRRIVSRETENSAPPRDRNEPLLS